MLKDFKRYFSDIRTDYINSFLPGATIEQGRTDASHTRYLIRLRKGEYRVHPDAIESHNASIKRPEVVDHNLAAKVPDY